LNQVMLNSTFVWRNDPVSFDNYPTFFLAHELAHQWWGHAIGWKNYHEQWISEGFAQYFAAMYAEKERPGTVLGNLVRQMRQTAIRASDQGPVYLGYRLGHIRGDDKVFRAVVYNKGAMVLHMLRRLLGDETFFAGLRGFYADWKFRKAGTDDFRVAMEKVSGRDLTRFFDTWIFGTEIPRVKFSYKIDGASAHVQFEQHGTPVDVPVTVTVQYADGSSDDVIVALSERTTEGTIALKGAVRAIVANGDSAALVEIDR
ncbi:MAG TPA: M1 family aminopeptidase, partial [Vicinamibacterales bacterium]